MCACVLRSRVLAKLRGPLSGLTIGKGDDALYSADLSSTRSRSTRGLLAERSSSFVRTAVRLTSGTRSNRRAHCHWYMCIRRNPGSPPSPPRLPDLVRLRHPRREPFRHKAGLILIPSPVAGAIVPMSQLFPGAPDVLDSRKSTPPTLLPSPYETAAVSSCFDEGHNRSETGMNDGPPPTPYLLSSRAIS